MNSETTLAVCLLSGGIDSAVAATLCKRDGYDLYLLSCNYDQVMQKELQCTDLLREYIRPIEHRTVELRGFRAISQSARTHSGLIQYDRAAIDDTVPSAYPPGRDFTFLSMGAAWAETLMLADPDRYQGAKIVIGTNYTDSLDYPDCQENVYLLFTALLKESLKVCKALGKNIEVETPLLNLTKQQVIVLGNDLGVPFEHTWSCYSGGGKACGRCDACRIRYFGFKDSGLQDPIEYENEEIFPILVGPRNWRTRSSRMTASG